MADKLNAYDDLAVIGSITSQNGQSSLVMQGDGNLVLYRSGGTARWATGTVGKVVSQAVMQGDGNFVMYGPGAVYIWDTATDGHPDHVLRRFDRGRKQGRFAESFGARRNLWRGETRPAELQNPRYQRHHRWPHCRYRRNRIPRWCADDSIVCPSRITTGRRFGRLAEA